MRSIPGSGSSLSRRKRVALATTAIVAVCAVSLLPGRGRAKRDGLPTSDDHFEEREHLGLCAHCAAEIKAGLALGGALVAWPYPLRKPFD